MEFHLQVQPTISKRASGSICGSDCMHSHFFLSTLSACHFIVTDFTAHNGTPIYKASVLLAVMLELTDVDEVNEN
jgi:hypothetical protein